MYVNVSYIDSTQHEYYVKVCAICVYLNAQLTQ
jgi:hypothetical protein